MADGSSTDTVVVQWNAWSPTTGAYQVRHFTGRDCPHCEGSGVDVVLYEPVTCGYCMGTRRELIPGCRCERCAELRETLP
jgi:hypothetical protein